jgi:ATP-dependent DNA helicase RecG
MASDLMKAMFADSPLDPRPESPTQSDDPVHRLLKALQSGDLSSGQLREVIEIKHRPTFRRNYLHPALESGFIEYTIPEKPNSRMQKYRLTDRGRQALVSGEGGGE